MSMLPEILGAEGTPHAIEFVYKGEPKRYTFKPLTFGLMEQVESEHLHQAKNRLRAMKDVLDEDTYTKKALDLYALYEAGEFGFLSARGQKWIKTPAGAACLLKLCLGIGDEELMPLLLAKGDEIKQLLEVVLREAGLQQVPRTKDQVPKEEKGVRTSSLELGTSDFRHHPGNPGQGP